MGRTRILVRQALWLAAAVFAAWAGPGTLQAARKSAARGWDHYKSRAKTLSRYRDRKELDDSAVLDILRGEGLLDSGGSPNGSFAKGFRPFRVRTYKGLWRWPLRYGIVSSEFGRRWGKRHKGIDIAADAGDKVYAAAPGEVIYSSSSLKGYGNVVILRHDDRTTSLYAHNSALKVRKGQRVHTGQVIALVGSTGRSTGPHVHFEIRRQEKAVDPRDILPRSRF